MHNLKFRAWDKANKEMLKIEVLDFFFKEIRVLKNNGSRFSMKFEAVEIMQSTGLFDKNGTEIFDGDILTDEGEFEGDYWDYGIIKFDETDFTYYIHWQNEEIDAHITDCSLYSIAGNIYKNKELLKK